MDMATHNNHNHNHNHHRSPPPKLPKLPRLPKAPPRKPIPEAVSIQLTAEILDVSELTVRRWIKRGHIKAFRVGPVLIRIPRSEIARMRTLRIAHNLYGDRVEYPQV